MLAFLTILSLAKAAVSRLDVVSQDGFCAWTLTDANGYIVHYNLTNFWIPDREDSENEVEDEQQVRRWLYMFNICGPLSKTYIASDNFPNKCKYNDPDLVAPCELGFINQTSGKCDKYVDMSQSSYQEPAAIQVKIQEDTSESNCFWLASHDTIDGQKYTPKQTVSLLDTEDSARGIVYKMFDGSYCEAARKNRELNVFFKCPDSARQYFSPAEEKLIINETVAEYPTCVYNLLIETALACPSECIYTNTTKLKVNGEKEKEELYSVCNRRGICAMDEIEATARCLCDEGYSGDKCEKIFDDHKHIDETNKSIQILVIFCIIILAIVFVLAAWLYTKLQNAKNMNIVGNSVNQAASLAQPIALDSQDVVVDTTTEHKKRRTRVPTTDQDEEDMFPSDNVVDNTDRVIEEEDNLHEDPSTKDEVNI